MCNPSEERNIVLIGFMGAGKSTVGRELERLAGLQLVDLDTEIIRRQGRSIPEIFAREGEAAFRDYETEALCSLAGLQRAVVATGGGVIGRQENWEAMRRLGIVVYLQASWETLRERLADSQGRPLGDPAADVNQVKALWDRRRPLYAQADLTVETDFEDAAGVARRILRLLAVGGENC